MFRQSERENLGPPLLNPWEPPESSSPMIMTDCRPKGNHPAFKWHPSTEGFFRLGKSEVEVPGISVTHSAGPAKIGQGGGQT